MKLKRNCRAVKNQVFLGGQILLLDALLCLRPGTPVPLLPQVATRTALSGESEEMHHIVLTFLNGSAD